MEDVAADWYKQKLQDKQQKSTEKPTSTASPGTPQAPKTIAEAFEQAKRMSG
jgi:hypothetical protein